MNRRDFSATMAGLAGLAALPSALATPAPARRLIKPPRLKPGALIGLIMPSGVTDDAHIEKCHRQLEALGFRVKDGRNIRAAWGGYAGSVKERLADLHDMFEDREVAAIWAGRGGSGASALLPGIRYDLIRRNPKILIGYSDITALHLALYRHAGLVTFHGPVASSSPTDYTVTQMQAVLMNPRPETTIYMSIENQRRAETHRHDDDSTSSVFDQQSASISASDRRLGSPASDTSRGRNASWHSSGCSSVASSPCRAQNRCANCQRETRSGPGR